MSQHNFSIADEAGAAYRADVNNALQALASQSSGTTEPSTKYAYQPWVDTSQSLVKRRNAANSAWVIIGSLAETFVISRASNTILGGSDYGRTFVATASFTQTFDAVSVLKDGWQVDYRIEAGVTIVFDPNASENIDGAATKSVTGPAGGTIRCDGSGFKTVGLDIVPIAGGGTGATTAAAAREALGDFTRTKDAEETLSSSATLQNDDDLTIPVGANDKIVGVFHLEAGDVLNTTGIKLAVIGPSGGTIDAWGSVVKSNGTTVAVGVQNSLAGSMDFPPGGFSGSSDAIITIHFRFLNSTTPGNLVLQWAQSTSSASVLRMRRGSLLKATRM